jgi:hypothetical protein
MPREMMNESLLQWIGRYQIAAVLALSLGSLHFAEQIAFSALVSGMLMTMNLQSMRFVLAGILRGPSGNGFYLSLLGFKLVLMMGAIAALILVFKLNTTGLMVGLFSFLPGVALGTVHTQLTTGSNELAEKES